MKVLISGYYGCGNLGDEAVLEAILKGLRERAPYLGLTVLSAQPALTSTFNNVKAVHRYDLFGVFKELDKADVLLSGGGSLFQDSTSRRSLWYYIGLVYLAKLFNKKVVIFAQGIGPLKCLSSRLIARAVLNRVDLIILRDDASRKTIRQLGVTKPEIRVTADPTFILGGGDKIEGKKILALEHVPVGKALLGVAIKKSDFTQQLAKQLDVICEKHKLVPVFLVFHFPADLSESRKIIDQMKTKAYLVFHACGVEEMKNIFAGLDFFIGMRLHALIFAALNKIPMLGLAYDPKVSSFMKAIDQSYIDLETLHLNAAFPALINDIFARKETIKKTLGERAQELQEKADKNFDLFFERLSK